MKKPAIDPEVRENLEGILKRARRGMLPAADMLATVQHCLDLLPK